MSMIKSDLMRRGISRLCHFTKSNNLAHILATGRICSVAELEREVEGFRRNDTQRLDGHPECICCTLEYPNAWYLDQARAADVTFPDWVVLTLDLSSVWHEKTRFSPSNAARSKGAMIGNGWYAYTTMFAPVVEGQRRFERSAFHPDWWPTDDQAEVLLANSVPLSQIQSVIVESEDQADREIARMRHLRLEDLLPPVFIAPEMFNKRRLSNAVRSGCRPAEVRFRERKR